MRNDRRLAASAASVSGARRRCRSSSASSSSGIARRMSSACAVTACRSSSSTPSSRRSSTSSASAGAGRSMGSSSAPVSDAMPPGLNERARCTRSWWVTRESASCSASGLRWSTRFWPKTESRSRSVSPWTSCEGRSWSSGRKRRRSTACVSSSAWLRSCSGGSPSRSSPSRSSVGALPLSWTCGCTAAAGGGSGSQPEEEVEEPVVGLDVLGGLDERRAQRVAHDRALADADVAQRVQRVEALRRRHADVVAPQDADEVGDDPVHLVRVVVPVSVGVIVPGAAVELQHLARLRGVAVVLDDHAERRVDELAVQRLRS